jgi:predicted ATPase
VQADLKRCLAAWEGLGRIESFRLGLEDASDRLRIPEKLYRREREWRDLLRDAVEPNGQLIVNLIPELELVIGRQPPVPELPPQEAQHRFQGVFRRFLGAFAQKEHPLILFLDDLQWIDAATLTLLEHLLSHPGTQYLLIIGAYRDNEVSRSHPLRLTLESIRQAGLIVKQIVLKPLSLKDLNHLIADALRCQRVHASSLARLVSKKTGATPSLRSSS